jgi:hypothetical protein
VVAEYRKRTKHKLLQEERKIKAKQGQNGREHIASKAATARQQQQGQNGREHGKAGVMRETILGCHLLQE